MKHPILATALAAAALPGVALAGISSSGGGDYGTTPLYRAFVFGGIDRGGDGGFDFDDVDGIDYVSNLAPKSYAGTNRSFTADGATMTTNGWAAYSGFYASRAYASMTVANANAGDGYYLVAGQGTGTTVRFHTPEAAASRATFTFHISGTESNPTGVGLSTGRLDFAASTDPTKNWIDLFTGNLDTLFAYGAGTYTYTLPTVPLDTDINLYFWSSAFTEIKAGQVAQGSSFTMSADYGHTFVLDGVQLYDTDDQAITQWSLQDTLSGDTVFDQSGRLAPVLAAPVPEPGSWALLLAGGAVMTGIARRRRVTSLRCPDRP